MARHTVLHSPRLARRLRKRAERRIARIISALVLVLGAVLFLITRDSFLIREVIVSGASEELSAAITETAREGLAGAYLSLVPKANAFVYPKREIEKVILERFPLVRSASVRLRSPSQLGVVVREREGVALWCAIHETADREECLRIDESGVAFEKAPRGVDALYRIRAGVNGRSVVPPLGTRVLPESRLSALLSFLRALETLSLSPSRLTLLQDGDVSAEIAGGGRILAREGVNFLKQAEHLRDLLSESELVPRGGEKLLVDYIDLRYGNKLYFKPR